MPDEFDALRGPTAPEPERVERLFPSGGGHDLDALKADLLETMARLRTAAASDPFANPPLSLALELSRRLEDGRLDLGTLEQLVQHLTVEGFLARARRLRALLGETDPAANLARLRRLVEDLADQAGSAEAFAQRLARAGYGFVFTAHPTFSVSGALTRRLAELAAGCTAEGVPLDEAQRARLVEEIAGQPHRPDTEISLAREHTLSVAALRRLRDAVAALLRLILEVARERWPEDWPVMARSWAPRPVTLATWVGYDLDGRSDIRWTDTLHKRLVLQEEQLRHYRAELRRIRRAAPEPEALANILDLAELRLTGAITEVHDEVQRLADYDPARDPTLAVLKAMGRRLADTAETRLTRAELPMQLLERAMAQMPVGAAGSDDRLLELALLRAQLATFGLGLAHTHVRINATQIHNAIRKAVGLRSAPDDPRFRQSYLNSVNRLLDEVQPVDINLGTIQAERTSAKRLFMVVAAILAHVDGSTPVRFLIAECETAFTCLAALYFARLFGIEDRLEICPLFENEKALQAGSRVIEQLLDNPHWQAYARRHGRVVVQTGYSDAGRFLGQTAASGSIERLKQRLARLLEREDLRGLELVVFDTHGESVGRGGHPGGFPARLDYVAAPAIRAGFARRGIPYKIETSWQGGDGYAPFFTPAGALAVLTRVLETLWPPVPPGEDPYYSDRDFVTEFFTTVKAFQVGLMEDPDYGALLSAIGPHFHYATGSRTARRQHDHAAEDIDLQHPSQFRAIPHNATLQQLGLLANTIGGVGEAIDKDPEHFATMYRASPRFRALIGMVEYAAAVSDPQVMAGYVATMDPMMWLQRAGGARDAASAAEAVALSQALEELPSHPRMARVLRRLLRDWEQMRRGFALIGAGEAPVPGAGRLVERDAAETLVLLHALRIALIHEIYALAIRVPPFSSRHDVTPRRIVARLLHLEVPYATEVLRQIFPATAAAAATDDFGQPSTYVSEETGDYSQENALLFGPMDRLYELIRRISTAITHRIGFHG